MAAGDCFGEIAALHGSPRTATVTTAEPSRLLTLTGSAFVMAVTGHKPAERVARSLIDHRLQSDTTRTASPNTPPA